MSRLLRWTAFTLVVLMGVYVVHAQITEQRKLSTQPDRFATLQEQLTNRLKATRNDQRNFIQFVVGRVRIGVLDQKLVVAIERYALRRNPHLPFPFFERALRFESRKRGVTLPAVKTFATTKNRGQ